MSTVCCSVQPKMLTREKRKNSKLGKCWKPAWILGKSGERGRNRTFNLLIKSQLLCQLSYAPIANGKVRTNFDYTIRIFAVRRVAEPLLQFHPALFPHGAVFSIWQKRLHVQQICARPTAADRRHDHARSARDDAAL